MHTFHSWKILQTFKIHSYVFTKITQLEKFSLKNQALKVHEKKLQQQLQQKKEMGKAEYEVQWKCEGISREAKKTGKRDFC